MTCEVAYKDLQWVLQTWIDACKRPSDIELMIKVAKKEARRDVDRDVEWISNHLERMIFNTFARSHDGGITASDAITILTRKYGKCRMNTGLRIIKKRMCDAFAVMGYKCDPSNCVWRGVVINDVTKPFSKTPNSFFLQPQHPEFYDAIPLFMEVKS